MQGVIMMKEQEVNDEDCMLVLDNAMSRVLPARCI